MLVPSGSQSIFNNKSCNSLGLKEVSITGTFMLGQSTIPATGKDDNPDIRVLPFSTGRKTSILGNGFVVPFISFPFKLIGSAML